RKSRGRRAASPSCHNTAACAVIWASSPARYAGSVGGDEMKNVEIDKAQPEIAGAATPPLPPPVVSPEAAAPQSAGEFRLRDVLPGAALLVGTVAVFNVAGRVCATQAKCTHKGGPLNEGTLDESTVTCPWHGSQFNVCTGAVVRGPAQEPLKTYRVSVEGDVGRVDGD